MENLREEFNRLRAEHEEKQLDIKLDGIDETIRYLTTFVPLEDFFKRLYQIGEDGEFWEHANYYYEKFRFNFQFVQSNISVARHFRYDRHSIHSHDFFQINYCYSGEGSVVIGEPDRNSAGKQTVIKMSAGDFNLLAPETLHCVRAFSDECVIIKYYIRKSTFERTFFAWLEEDDILSGFFQNAIRGGRNSYINFHTGGDEMISQIALMIYMDMMNHKPYFGILSESRLTELFCLIVRDHSISAETRLDFGRKEGSAAQLYTYLRENYRDASLEAAAKALGYSKNYLCRIVAKTTGKTFSELLNEVRISEAKKLLAGNFDSVSEVGRLVGYVSDEHFHRMFRKIAGVTPREWTTNLK